MARRVEAPDFLISAMIGKTLPAARSASSPRPLAARGLDIRIAALDALCLRRSERRLGRAGDYRTLLFRERSIKVQDEGIDVRPQFRDDEGNPMRHQAGNKMHVGARYDRAWRPRPGTAAPVLGERCRQSRPAVVAPNETSASIRVRAVG
jgi:hypothetical protein